MDKQHVPGRHGLNQYSMGVDKCLLLLAALNTEIELSHIDKHNQEETSGAPPGPGIRGRINIFVCSSRNTKIVPTLPEIICVNNLIYQINEKRTFNVRCSRKYSRHKCLALCFCLIYVALIYTNDTYALHYITML